MGLPKRFLALETSGPETSAALFVGGEPRVFRKSFPPFAHSSLLPGWVLNLLDEEGISPADLDGVALSGGPGYFTALRMGLVFAKALHLLHGTRVVLVSTPEALVMELPLPEGAEITVLLDAQKGEVHRAVLRKARPLPERLENLALVAVEGLEITTPYVAGSGLARYFPEHPARVHPTPLQPSAMGVGLWALSALQEGLVRLEDPTHLTLRYGRLPDAVVHRQKGRSSSSEPFQKAG